MNYNQVDFISPAASIGTRLSPNVVGQSDSLPFLSTSSLAAYVNEIDLPFNTSRCAIGSGWRPKCLLWNNVTSLWNTSGTRSYI